MRLSIWKSAIAIPLGCLFLGVAYAFLEPPNPNDWLGLGIFVRLGVTLAVASLLALILSIWAFKRRETKAPVTLIFSIPSVCFLLWLGGYFIEDFTRRRRAESEEELFRKTYTSIQKDPSLLRSRDWSKAAPPERRAFSNSLEFGTAPYISEDIVYVYETYSAINAFRHPACPESLLTEHFEQAWDLCESGQSYGMLAAICSNPNTPVELLERVAGSKSLASGAVRPAQKTLEKIKKQNNAEMATPRMPSD